MQLNHRDLYRLPWTLSDNVITWLEPTKKCNIYCDGCYSVNNPGREKSLEQIAQDLDVFDKYRNTHSVSIAGGDPLCHPEIVKVVEMVAKRGNNPIVNTNGFAMTEDLMRRLKDAGMKGLTFHIDSLQTREGWTGKSELELNELRLKYAEMAARVGGLSCSFNATVYDKTLKYVPELLKWAQEHIDIVNVMVFIAFRSVDPTKKFDYYVNGEKIVTDSLAYGDTRGHRVNITAPEIVAEIRKVYPDFQPCGYLNGTEDPAAFKWLLTLRAGNKKHILGYFGPKFAEMAQSLHHLVYGKYLGYVHPKVMGRVRMMMPLGIFDKGLRGIAGKFLGTPSSWFGSVRMQSVMIIQPADIFEDGRQSMCDGCPDMTAWNGRLVWSCRLEEQLKYGANMTMFPTKDKAKS